MTLYPYNYTFIVMHSGFNCIVVQTCMTSYFIMYTVVVHCIMYALKVLTEPD